MKKEVWVKLDRLPEGYEISNYGRVKSVDRYIDRASGPVHVRERILKPSYDKQTRAAHIAVSHRGKNKTYWVARLVAEAFIGDPTGKDVKTIDGNNKNLYYKNIFMVSRKNSVQFDLQKGRRHAKLDENDIINIRRLIRAGVITTDIGKRYGVSQTLISQIKNHKIYGWVPYEKTRN